MTTRRWLIVLVGALALLIVVGRIVAEVFAEWTWYASQGALPLYQSMLAHQVALRGGAALIAFSFAFANLYTVRKSIVSLVLPRRLGNIELAEAVEGRLLTLAVLALSSLLAILLTIPEFSWTSLALARSAVPFNELDPYLDRDFGFYIYHLPFERSAYLWAVVTMMLVTLVVVALYALTPSYGWRGAGSMSRRMCDVILRRSPRSASHYWRGATGCSCSHWCPVVPV